MMFPNIPETCSIIIVGGGPCGLMLANELGRRGVSAVLIDQKSTTAFNPQANATQARTMEHYRRLGFSAEIRSQGLPPDFPTDVSYCTRFAKYELARFKLPSAREAAARIATLSGSWSAAELPHRISQKYVEATLRRHAETLPGISINYGYRLVGLDETNGGVLARVERVYDGRTGEIKGAYLVGADGPRSTVRQRLDIAYGGETGVSRDFMGGRMYAVYLRSAEFYRAVPHAPAWMNVAFNRDRRAFMAAVDGRSEFAFHTQLYDDEDPDRLTESDAVNLFQAVVGARVGAEILSRGAWTAGHTLVAEKFSQGRVFLAGDAVHLFTPTGGLGYNTAVDDAVNLGWKLAAVVKGCGGQTLLDSYERERRPLAIRNTGFARSFADSLGLSRPAAEIEDETPAGETARARAGAVLADHARKEFNIPGITFGARYDGSPIIVSDGTDPPPDSINTYTPTATPGGRAPHVWLNDGLSLYDTFSFEWTLLRLTSDGHANGPDSAFCASAHGPDVRSVNIASGQVRDLYGADYALIRPDQIVAWRGNTLPSKEVIAIVSGISAVCAGKQIAASDRSYPTSNVV
jgi:2-polyprenyl-6-methoxyphenol hydroxylase-like FAD-dependent oxidoreductase